MPYTEFGGVPVVELLGSINVLLYDDLADYVLLFSDCVDSGDIIQVPFEENIKLWSSANKVKVYSDQIVDFDYNRAIVDSIRKGRSAIVIPNKFFSR